MVNTSALWFMVVAAMWGGTNPLIKRGSKGVENIKENNRIKQFVSELKFLFFNWKYLIPFGINQGGSVVYYLTLATADLSLAVPITNSLTFIFTSISGTLLGEKPPSLETCLGMVLVVCGVSLCVFDKV
ncbi:transmembrane protein 234 homolog [Mizuhopecten yessoensis]|uniref:transmembrane protein 234 homolog n=1 Tax=Mizuhopecten yessoensis TaxID=6573 RepID=UPI000B45AF24|nr:transmembrane protein 234 homolog [Mizuhopecten yessoensis]